MPQQYRNSFNAGVLDELLESRIDLRKWRAALLQGDNVILLPQGGVKRRPGTKYVATLGPGNRLGRFRVGYSTQYLLVFGDEEVEVWSTDDEQITTLVAPWADTQIGALAWSQNADTMILCHEDVAPHRLFRALCGSNPLKTTNGSAVVRVTLADHGLLTGDEIGLSGAEAAGGLTAGNLAGSFSVTTAGGALDADPLTTTATSNEVKVKITGHGLIVGDRFRLSGLSAVRYNTGGGRYTEVIPAIELNRTQVVTTVVDSNHVKFETQTTATNSVATAGGDGGRWFDLDHFTVEAPELATSSTSGGGSAVLVWSLISLDPALDPNDERKVVLKNIPKFNFKDQDSPEPANEQQKLTFDSFSTGDRFKLLASGTTNEDAKGESAKLEYASDNDENAATIQEALNEIYGTTGIRVDFESTSGAEDYYTVTFTGDAGLTDWPPISYKITNSASGSITVEELSTGGSTAEPVWSDDRGWPRACVFHQRRLWFVASKSRPISVYASVTEDFFNFDVGQAQPSDAIDSTGEFDPIRHIVLAQKGLHLITTGSVVNIVPDRDTGGFIPPLAYERGDNYGGSDVAPAVLAGLPCYVDVIERSIRQIRFDVDTNGIISAEISQFAQSLITDPVRLETIRTGDGDYLYVVNSDGTIACLCLDVPQRVMGWTRFTTADGGTGGFYDLAEVGGFMYVAVDRQNGRFLEKFDPARYTDAGAILTGSDDTEWTVDHLGLATDLHVRGDGATLDAVSTNGDGDFTTQVAGVDHPCDSVEVGYPFIVTVRPTPPSLGRRTRLVACTVDILDTREITVGGYRVVTRNSSNLGAADLATGLYRVPLSGWGRNKTVTIEQNAPQPFLLRGLELEAA